jgi:hypothetical protein
MTVESFLEKKLQQFSIVDFALVKSVYFFISLLVFSLYPKLSSLDWLFYLIMALMCGIPLWIHLFSQSGNLIEKMHGYLKTNGPPKQVLLFLSVFFFALMLGVLIPFIVTFTWWYYIIIAIILAIKPLTVTWFW